MTPSTFPPAGWTRYRATWCKVVGDLSAEISRALNDETGLIEWHVISWRGRNREDLELDEFTGQDFHDALALARESLGLEAA